MFLLATFFDKATTNVTARRSFVERVHIELNLAEIEVNKSVVQDQHHGFGSMTLAPVRLFSDGDAEGRMSRYAVDTVKSDNADGLILSRRDHKDIVSESILCECFEPLFLIHLIEGVLSSQELGYFFVVHPPQGEREILTEGDEEVGIHPLGPRVRHDGFARLHVFSPL